MKPISQSPTGRDVDRPNVSRSVSSEGVDCGLWNELENITQISSERPPSSLLVANMSTVIN